MSSARCAKIIVAEIRPVMRARLAAAAVFLGWILGSMALLLMFRGIPLRVRGLLILGSLLVLIGAISVIKLIRAARK